MRVKLKIKSAAFLKHYVVLFCKCATLFYRLYEASSVMLSVLDTETTLELHCLPPTLMSKTSGFKSFGIESESMKHSH